jgi:hypothetical protein
MELSINVGLKGLKATDLHSVSNSGTIRLGSAVTGGPERYLDAHIWLPRAAEHYNISPRLRDYVIIPVPVCITEMPNTNGDSASLKELMTFKPDLGMLTYRTWCAKPFFVEHDNRNIKKAQGVIFDSYLRPLKGYNGKHAKLIHLAGIDRERNPQLAEAYLTGKANSFSMGMWYKAYTCSLCGQKVGQGIGSICTHTRPQKSTYVSVSGKLVYRQCHDLVGFELSGVSDPAFCIAVNNTVIDPRNPNHVG